MIKVNVGNNLKQEVVVVDENTTLRQVFEDSGINYSTGMNTLDGAPLRPGDLDKSFAEHGITESCWLLSVIKADNAK